MFLILLFRFYWGAYRYIQEQPEGTTVGMTILNLCGAFGLFSLFYVISTTLWTTDLFYALILLMHIFDAGYFGLLLWKLKATSPLNDPAKYLLLLDLLTLVAYLVLYSVFRMGFWDGTHLYLQASLLVSLLVLTILDWGVLWKFYFLPTEWRKQFAQAAPAP